MIDYKHRLQERYRARRRRDWLIIGVGIGFVVWWLLTTPAGAQTTTCSIQGSQITCYNPQPAGTLPRVFQGNGPAIYSGVIGGKAAADLIKALSTTKKEDAR